MQILRNLGLNDPDRPVTFTGDGLLPPDSILRNLRGHWQATVAAELARVISFLRHGPTLLTLSTSVRDERPDEQPLNLLTHGARIISGNNRIVFGDLKSAQAEITRQDAAHRGFTMGSQSQAPLPSWYQERYGFAPFSPFNRQLRLHVLTALVRTTSEAYAAYGLLTPNDASTFLAELRTTLGQTAGGFPYQTLREVQEADDAFMSTELMEGPALRASGAAQALHSLLMSPLEGNTRVIDLWNLVGGFVRPEDREAFAPLLAQIDDEISLRWGPDEQLVFDTWTTAYSRRVQDNNVRPDDLFAIASRSTTP